MSAPTVKFDKEYAAAIEDYLAGRGEAALHRAYAAGRKALAQGEGVLGVVAAHQESMAHALQFTGVPGSARLAEDSISCLAESLSPFEMVLRGIQETNARVQQSLSSLQSVEEQLRRQNEELTAAHRTVERERSRYQALFAFAPDAYLVTGMEGAIWEANAAAAALLRTPHDRLPGQSLHEFVADTDRPEFRKRLRELHAGSIEKLSDWEIGIQPQHTATIPAALTVVAERSGPAVAGLRWLIRDITERKRLEKERIRWLVSRTKAKAARRFEFLAEASALLVGPLNVEASLASVARLAASFLRGWCFICVVEPDGSLRQLEAAHPDAESDELAAQLRQHCLFGGKADSLPMNTEEIEPLTPEWCDNAADSPEHAQLLRRLGGCGATVLPLRIRERLTGVMVLVRTFGSRRYHTANRVLHEDLAGRCALALENARLYREVVAQRDKAEKASRAKDEFVAILGHELRNPLTPVVGWTRVLKNDPAIVQNSVLAEGVAALEKNAIALTRLVDECVDMAKISEGKIQIECTPVDLNQIARATAEAVRGMAATRNLKLETELLPEPVQVLGDAMRLEQVVTNLLINAVKYTNPEGLISLRVISSDGQAELEVSDTGIGIEPAFLEQIFEPFRQGAASWLTSQSGLGLGLSIARRIVELHGGSIWAESAGLGSGSAFHVRLPLAELAADFPMVGAPKKRAIARTSARTSSVRILLTEDSADILFLMKTELEAMGHEVAVAAHGRAALESARSLVPDLLISDIKMPVMDGYELIRTIRRDPAFANLPAIALTGFGSKAEVERALAAGFDVCLTKPAEPEQIATLIGQFGLNKRAARRDSE
jgi:PAS domain S-box-containing protein